MTRAQRQIQRRVLLALVGDGAAHGALWSGSRANAHDGLHQSLGGDINLTAAQLKGTTLTLLLEIKAPDAHAVTLEHVETDIGQAAQIYLPLAIAAGGHIELPLDIALPAGTQVPGLFTLLLDFGEGGAGPFTVFTPSDIYDA